VLTRGGVRGGVGDDVRGMRPRRCGNDGSLQRGRRRRRDATATAAACSVERCGDGGGNVERGRGGDAAAASSKGAGRTDSTVGGGAGRPDSSVGGGALVGATESSGRNDRRSVASPPGTAKCWRRRRGRRVIYTRTSLVPVGGFNRD
jgi:hypothetical protein